MKKLLTPLYAIGLLLASGSLASADNSINPCPGSIGSICNNNGPANIGTLIQIIITYLFIAGAVIAVVFLVWGGIKWIISGGDKAKVQAARDTIIGAIIGLIIVFASYFIVSLLLSTLFGLTLSTFKLPQLSTG